MPLPKFQDYKRNSLRPNATTADPARGFDAFLQEVINVGHFSKPNDGSAASWGTSARIVNGIATPGKTTPGGLGLDSEVTKPRKNIRRPLY